MMKQFLKTDIRTPVEFISGGQFFSKQQWTHARRNIDSHELIIGVNETLYIQQDDIRYEVNPGDVLLLLPFHTHQGFAACSPNLSFYWCHFHCPGGRSIIDRMEMDQEVLELRNYVHTNRSSSNMYIPIFSKPSMIERINILFNQLLDVANSNYYNKLGVHYYATCLLVEISEQTIMNFHTTNERTESDKNMAKILEWIRIHALGDISVQAIAEEFNYNRDYLSRLFKKKIGINIQEYIHTLKLSKAKDMLTRTNHSIKQISYDIGIFDEKYFMRLFKKYEKMTPTEYRKAYYRTHMNNK